MMEGLEYERSPSPPPYKWLSIAILLFVSGIVSGLVFGYCVSGEQIDFLRNEVANLQYNNAQLQYQITQLKTSYDSLLASYDSLNAEYQKLQEKYRFSPTIPYTLICNGTIQWLFKDMRGNILKWQIPIDTYRAYVNREKSKDYVKLSFKNGTTVKVLDMRNYIEPKFFSNVILELARGRTDEEFVREVDNVKNQIVVYGTGLGDYYRWPVETLIEGRGQCGDTTILMASMIIKGNHLMNYGMKIYIWYVDAEHISDPVNVNHALIEVEFKSGNRWIIETTANYFYNYLEHQSVSGWKYDVTYQGLGN
ncbi:MAG: hypothetical protein FGF53_02600 [Candidatus Brockarchaeota archaeon]|nr:hypothetical protein [Candidatus Brockarchaeota archaeon]MBO3808796.1 hypothetical protein [Candidatus Brockarchaeota archaeon]